MCISVCVSVFACTHVCVCLYTCVNDRTSVHISETERPCAPQCRRVDPGSSDLNTCSGGQLHAQPHGTVHTTHLSTWHTILSLYQQTISWALYWVCVKSPGRVRGWYTHVHRAIHFTIHLTIRNWLSLFCVQISDCGTQYNTRVLWCTLSVEDDLWIEPQCFFGNGTKYSTNLSRNTIQALSEVRYGKHFFSVRHGRMSRALLTSENGLRHPGLVLVSARRSALWETITFKDIVCQEG